MNTCFYFSSKQRKIHNDPICLSLQSPKSPQSLLSGVHRPHPSISILVEAGDSINDRFLFSLLRLPDRPVLPLTSPHDRRPPVFFGGLGPGYRILVATVLAIFLLPVFDLHWGWTQAMPENAANQVRDSTAGAALRSIFSPSAAPERKTMGLLQRSFFEVARQQANQDLEIALVIDGTHSMAAEIAGIQDSIGAMLEDLQRTRRGEVRVAVVVYRDSGSPSGTVQLLLPKFITGEKEIQRELAKIQPETGVPYFHEMVDQGLHAALTQLPWSDQSDRAGTARWIILLGDAPPYPENFQDANVPQARRAYATDFLINLAAQRQVVIHCLLTSSNQVLQEPFQEALPETRQFMHRLAAATGGLFLDTAYDDVRAAILKAGRQPRYEHQQIQPIGSRELTMERRKQRTLVKFLVLPHLSKPAAWKTHFAVLQLNQPQHQAEVADLQALTEQLKGVPWIHVVDRRKVVAAIEELQAEGLIANNTPFRVALQKIAETLRVQYVIAGKNAEQGRTSILYRIAEDATDLQYLRRFDWNDNTSNTVLAKLFSNPEQTANPEQTGFLEDILNDLSLPQATLEESIRADNFAEFDRNTWLRIRDVEALLELPVGEPQSLAMAKAILQTLQQVNQQNKENVIDHWLQANVLHNLAMAKHAAGDQQGRDQALNELRDVLRTARINLTETKRFSPSLRGEIQADYELLCGQDVAKAIERYEGLVSKPNQISSETRRRAHWMLAGIYSGDWGVGPGFRDAAKARQQILALLTQWPDSREATAFRKWLGWDEKTQESTYPYVPRAHSFFLTGK